ncbi:unnamed protein product [Ranitomeya imitator]|uniref:Uncharacterized protein n=1 Tax=Ranitomeya imitator TaxID=111125 RepID=A0ABN9M084_9NEOB|nr:unnamed protein product [Ranitomeya imitator]
MTLNQNFPSIRWMSFLLQRTTDPSKKFTQVKQTEQPVELLRCHQFRGEMTLQVSAAWTLHPSPRPLCPSFNELGRSRMTTFVNKKELGAPLLPVYAFHILVTDSPLHTLHGSGHCAVPTPGPSQETSDLSPSILYLSDFKRWLLLLMPWETE